MLNQLTWYAPQQALRLTLRGNLSSDEMEQINHYLISVLDSSEHKLQLLVDLSEFQSGYSTIHDLRATQKYIDHDQLESIVVIASNKLNRLVGMLTFNLARARFVMMDSIESAHRHMERKGILESETAIKL